MMANNMTTPITLISKVIPHTTFYIIYAGADRWNTVLSQQYICLGWQVYARSDCYNSTPYSKIKFYVDQQCMMQEVCDTNTGGVRRFHASSTWKSSGMSYSIRHSTDDSHDGLNTMFRIPTEP